MNKFKLVINQDSFWNKDEFLKFLVKNQGLPIRLSTNAEGVCLNATEIYKLLEIFNYTDVNVFTSNSLETHPIFKIQIEFFDRWFLNTADIDPTYQTWDQSKIFGCFYNRPTWYRIGLASFLYAHCKSMSLTNFRANPFNKEQYNWFDLNTLLINSPDSIYDFSKLMPELPLIADKNELFKVGGHPSIYEEQLKDYYKTFLIEIVAETWTEGNTFAPTEKTTRPINFKKPFIVYGSRDYLCYLRQMGFRTFNDFWDEDYDGYEGVERFKRILNLLDFLSKKSVKELETMYGDMQYTLEHNYTLLKNKNYNTNITPID
jgi:hypothetical protein